MAPPSPSARVPLVWDMETGDPDDFLTLLLLLDHPQVELRAVTITPGTPDQVGLVRQALAWLDRTDVPVGAGNLDHPKPCVSPWHYKAYGQAPPSRDAEPAAELLLRVLDADATLLTGAPPKNLGAALALGEARGTPLRLGRWVAQGGFAGEGVVPAELQLEKFRGLRTCPSFNLNGAPKVVFAALAAPGIGRHRFVSKNVCHGVVYDAALHARLAPLRDRRRSFERVWHGMDRYLADHPDGKAFHDPLAAACALDETIATWADVTIIREQGQWGAIPAANDGRTRIIVAHDHERFVTTLFAS